MSKDFYFEVSAGSVSGHSAVNVVGADSQIGSSLATVGLNTGNLLEYSTTADIDTISSENAGDTHDVTISGLDVNYEPVADQVVTLNGQNKVVLGTPLFRVTGISNNTGTASAGIIWIYVDTPIVGGKPTDLTKIRCGIQFDFTSTVSAERSILSSFTVPANKKAFVVFGKTSVSDQKALQLTFWGKAPGGVFQLIHPIAIKDNTYDYFFKLPGVLDEKFDVEVRGKVDTGTAIVTASYDIVLVDK